MNNPQRLLGVFFIVAVIKSVLVDLDLVNQQFITTIRPKFVRNYFQTSPILTEWKIKKSQKIGLFV